MTRELGADLAVSRLQASRFDVPGLKRMGLVLGLVSVPCVLSPRCPEDSCRTRGFSGSLACACTPCLATHSAMQEAKHPSFQGLSPSGFYMIVQGVM